jgi:uncharacterized protein (TIRG00374 family)
MTRRSKTILQYLFSILLAVVFLYLAFRGTDFQKLAQLIGGANYWWIALTFGCLILSDWVRALRWRYLLNPIKPNIGMHNLFSAVMIGYFMNNVFPRAGEIARPYALGKLEAIPKSAALGTIVVERIIDTISFLILVVLMPLVYAGPLRESFPWLTQSGILISSVTAVMLVFIITLMLRRDWTDTLLTKTLRFLPNRFAKRMHGATHSFLDGFLFLKRPGSFFVIGVLSVCIWGLYVLMTYFAFFAFDLQRHLGLGAALVVLTISTIGVALPTPGATGTYHVFATQALSRLFNVPNELALGYATITHAVGFIGVSVIGVYYLFKDHIKVGEAMSDLSETQA